MDRPEEIRAMGQLAGDALAETVNVVADVHKAIADRVNSALPEPAKPIGQIVSMLTAATYATVRTAHRWIPRLTATVASATTASKGARIAAKIGSYQIQPTTIPTPIGANDLNSRDRSSRRCSASGIAASSRRLRLPAAGPDTGGAVTPSYLSPRLIN